MNKKKRFEYNYLPEFIYGGTDGAITTLAIVSGVVGAGLNSSIILILGFVNLFADGFSMAVSNYLSTKSRNDIKGSKFRMKQNAMITSFVTFISFFVIGFIPLFSFVLAWITNIDFIIRNQFIYSAFLTIMALGIIGWFKGDVLEKNRLNSSIQTILIGGAAAIIAFSAGYFINFIIS